MRHATKRRVSVLATVISALLIANIAFAAWLSTGEGEGEAKAGVASNGSTVASADEGDVLYPGSDTTITVTVTNDEAYPVRVTGFDAGSSDEIAGTDCLADTVTTDADSSPATTVIASKGTANYELDAHMASDADNDCQGQTFTIPLDFDLESAAD